MPACRPVYGVDGAARLARLSHGFVPSYHPEGMHASREVDAVAAGRTSLCVGVDVEVLVRDCADRMRRLEVQMRELRSMLERIGAQPPTDQIRRP